MLYRGNLYSQFTTFRHLIDYRGIIYDEPHSSSFCKKFESAQYKAVLALTGSIQITSRGKIFQELGLRSIKSRRLFRRLCCMFVFYSSSTKRYFQTKQYF